MISRLKLELENKLSDYEKHRINIMHDIDALENHIEYENQHKLKNGEVDFHDMRIEELKRQLNIRKTELEYVNKYISSTNKRLKEVKERNLITSFEAITELNEWYNKDLSKLNGNECPIMIANKLHEILSRVTEA